MTGGAITAFSLSSRGRCLRFCASIRSSGVSFRRGKWWRTSRPSVRAFRLALRWRTRAAQRCLHRAGGALLGEFGPDEIAERLSGILIGHEIRAGLASAKGAGRRFCWWARQHFSRATVWPSRASDLKPGRDRSMRRWRASGGSACWVARAEPVQAALPKRSIRKSSSGISVRPVVMSSAIVSPTPGPSWKPLPEKPKAWNRPGVVFDWPITGSISGR